MIGDHQQQQQPSKHIELDKSFHLVPHLPASDQDCIIHSFDVLSADVIASIIAVPDLNTVGSAADLCFTRVFGQAIAPEQRQALFEAFQRFSSGPSPV